MINRYCHPSSFFKKILKWTFITCKGQHPFLQINRTFMRVLQQWHCKFWLPSPKITPFFLILCSHKMGWFLHEWVYRWLFYREIEPVIYKLTAISWKLTQSSQFKTQPKLNETWFYQNSMRLGFTKTQWDTSFQLKNKLKMTFKIHPS